MLASNVGKVVHTSCSSFSKRRRPNEGAALAVLGCRCDGVAREDRVRRLGQDVKGGRVKAIDNRRRLAVVLLPLAMASCTSHAGDDGSVVCRNEAHENLEVCRTSAVPLTPFLQNLCAEEFEEQLQACAP